MFVDVRLERGVSEVDRLKRTTDRCVFGTSLFGPTLHQHSAFSSDSGSFIPK
jgi:hypothetical protein